MLTHFSLFSGIGGIDLAAEWAGFESVGQCEFADYPTKVLEKHWPNVPRWRDVRDVTAKSFRERTGLQAISLISAGYPCQRFSVAGTRTGELDFALQFIRIVSELRPRWALGENVGGHITNGLDDVLRGLEQEGYATRPFVVQAKAVGAPHKRERVFIVAYANSSRQEERDIPTIAEKQGFDSGMGYEELAYASNESNAQTHSPLSSIRSKLDTWNDVSRSYWGSQPEPNWAVPKSELVRMAHGLSNGLDALGCLGNAVVPQQVYPILQAIADIEQGGYQL